MMDRRKLVNVRKNPFFKHSKIKFFIAKKDGKVVGRIAGIINDNHNKTHKDKIGFFGFFESINDTNVSGLLFNAVEEWLKEQGMNTIRGPVNPSMNDETGLLVEGFDSPPVLLSTYNPKYYQNLIAASGFNKAMDLFAYWLKNEDYVSDKMERANEIITKRYGLTFRPINLKDKEQFKKDVESIKYVYNNAWEDNWGFVKMTDEEIDFLAADLKTFVDPNYVIFVESNGKMAGIIIALPDLNQVLIHNKKGKLPGALYHLITKKKKIDTLRILALGIMPEFRGKGIDSALYYQIGKVSRPRGIKYGEASWILENNEMMNRGLTQIMKGKRYKVFRLFEKEI